MSPQADSDFDIIPLGPERLAEHIPIHTCNPGDFDGIEGLAVRAVPHPDR